MKTIIPALPPGDVLVYKFGCRLDKSSEQIASDQIALARRLYNDIIACMRQQVQSRAEKEIELGGDEAASINTEIAALTDKFKAAKAKNDETAMVAIATERRKAWGNLSLALKGVRVQHKDVLKTYLMPIGRTAASSTYQLRSKYVQLGLGWGTANAILENALQAFQSTIKTGQAPHFARGDDKIKDTLTLQFTTAGGVPIERIVAGEHNEFKLSIPHDGVGRRCYGEMRFRLGAAKDDQWASGTWQAHRAIPNDANVAGVSLVRERIGRKHQWNIQLLLKLKTPIKIETERRQSLAVIHLGWSADSTGRRIGAIADAADAGLAQLIQLPPSIEENLARAKSIQGRRDAARDAVHEKLKTVAKSYWDTWPPELADEIKAILKLPAQHVAISRLHRLIWRLSNAQIPPHQLDFLEQWRRLDKIEHQSSTSIAKRARNARRDFYRDLSLQQCKKYSSIIIDSVDLKDAAVVVDDVSGEHTELAKKARAGRVVAALYEYTNALKWAASRCDTAIIESNGKAVATCSACGSEGLQNVEGSQYQCLQCPHCGAVHDRKCNAAAVIYQTLCKNAQDYFEQSVFAKQDAVSKRLEKQREKLDKVVAARRARIERESQVTQEI